MSDRIRSIRAREILDSRGFPTVEAEIILDSGLTARAAVPSGASTGKFEAVELRDADEKRYHGKGVLKAIHHIIENIAPAVTGIDPVDQSAVDQKILSLDPSAQKEKLGANATLAVSMAATRASALIQKATLAETIAKIFKPTKMTMPVPFMNIINGGMHADNNLDFQEFMIAPVQAKSFAEALRMGAEVFHTLKGILKKKGLSTSVGDEGGFAPRLKSHEEALQLIMDAVNQCGYGAHIKLALDVASSSFYENGKYVLTKSNRGAQSSEQMMEIYGQLLHEFPIVSIEDGLDEEDWKGWRLMTEKFPNTQLVGDDLFVTQVSRLERGIKERSANAILIKLNQVGTVSETFQTMQMAMKNGFNCMVSHRSGETEDTFIADLAVGTGAGQIKTGSLCRTDRTAKYNQLIRLEESLKLSYAKLS
ncbi:MAG: phosphopyruvate hydratase [Deltaproteobacteria bacterium]|nr:phosphopyruvate hydratase [Deltaproteobacteria bacterium]